MKQYAAYLFDLDGTLYRGEEAIPYAADVVRQLRDQGAAIRFHTNNSSRTRADFCAKLCRLGFPCEESDIYSSATGTADYLNSQGLSTAYVIGMDGLRATLADAGVEVVTRQAQAAVVGICLDLTYRMLSEAMQQILGGARFVATNPDATFPLENGRLTPGAGTIVAAVQTCSGATPFVVGKPNPYLVELALRDAGISSSQALVVGDRIDTDIESGRRAGCDTHLVLTGVETTSPPTQPSSPDLRGLLETL